MTTIAYRLQAVNERIARASLAAGRVAQDVTLVAVSKTFPPSAISEAYAAGQADFGENYLQEGLEKIRALAGLNIRWHYIGPIQSNKTRPIAENFSWIHGVDREKIAVRLSDARPPDLQPLQICIQVNVSGEQSKGGVPPEQALDLAVAISSLPRLQLRGLMTIPEPTTDVDLRHRQFRALSALLGQIVRGGVALDTLSMGMSDDLEAAIAEGATIVRIGTAIFGERPPLRSM